jgi:hypothetical protein
MRISPLLLAIAGAAAIASGCSVAGIMAGGQGNSTDFGEGPTTPSPAIVPGEYVLRCTAITTNPAKQIDQNQALKDTITINIQAGPSSNTTAINGMYLDPRVNDLVYVRDRGGNTWEAVSKGGVTMSIVTDATGSPQQYLIGTTSVSTEGAQISSQRTFSFGYPLPGSAPGLFVANVQTIGGPDINRPLQPGDNNYFVMRADGVCQWAHDIGVNLDHYWVDAANNCLRAQFTEYNPDDSPANLEEEDLLFLPLYINEAHTETNHASGTVDHTWSYGGAFFSVSSPGVYYGTCSGVQGVYGGHPYYMTNNQSVPYFTVNQGVVQIALTEGNEKNVAFDIISLSPSDLIAVRAIGLSGYEILDIFRNTNQGSTVEQGGGDTNLTEPNGAGLTVSSYDYAANGGPDILAGQYTIPNLLNDPNSSTPPP